MRGPFTAIDKYQNKCVSVWDLFRSFICLILLFIGSLSFSRSFSALFSSAIPIFFYSYSNWNRSYQIRELCDGTPDNRVAEQIRSQRGRFEKEPIEKRRGERKALPNDKIASFRRLCGCCASHRSSIFALSAEPRAIVRSSLIGGSLEDPLFNSSARPRHENHAKPYRREHRLTIHRYDLDEFPSPIPFNAKRLS